MAHQDTVRTRPGGMAQALAANRLGVPAVLFFILASVAPLTVAAGVLPTAFAATGLTGIPAAFIAIGIVMALFSVGYIAMTRYVTNSGAFYAFITRGLGRPVGVAAALVALLAYTFLQIGLYGALGPAAQSEASQHLGIHASWWVWALIGWAIVTVLGLLRVDITGKVLGVLLSIELLVTIAEAISGLANPFHNHLSFATLSPHDLTTAGFGTFGVLAVIAVLGFVGFEQAPVLGEEARNGRRTIPAATYGAIVVIAVVYALASWAMTVHAGTSGVVGAARAEGPGVFFTLGNTGLGDAAQLLYMTSLFAAALSFHNCVWRYMFALGREQVLPSVLGRTGRNNIPHTASLVQSVMAGLAILAYAEGGWDPMTHLFFWWGTTGGFGVLLLLAGTSLAVIVFFARNNREENIWRRLIAPGLALIIMIVIVVLACQHYASLLGVAPGSAVAWIMPVLYAVVAVIGLAWGLALRSRRSVYEGIGLGPAAAASRGSRTPEEVA